MTRENIKKALAIIVDGDVITAPVIQDTILGGTSIISGHFTKKGPIALLKGSLENKIAQGAALGQNTYVRCKYAKIKN